MADSPPYRWRWVALFVILAAEVIDLLDTTIINVAAPSIRAELGGSTTAIQWFAAGYTLAFAVGLVTGGRLGDLYGRRRMFLVGIAGFTVASALCGLAASPEMLIGCRLLQGAFGAILIPQGLGIIRAVFPPKEMAAAFGAFGPVMGLAAVCGPILAGVLIHADVFGLGWRTVFLVNVPIGVLAFLGALRFVPESRSPKPERLDPVGALLITSALLLLVYPLVQGRELDWPAWTFASMAASVPLFALFAWWELRVHARGGSPLVVPSLLRRRGFSIGLVVGLGFFAAVAGLMLAFSLFTQIALGYSALRAGLTLIPLSTAIAVSATLAGAWLAPRYGRRVLHAGIVITVAGAAAQLVTLRIAGTDVTSWEFAPSLAVIGFGMGLLFGPFFDLVLADVDEHETGSAAGTLNAVQQLAGAVGVAVLGTVFFAPLTDAGAGNPVGPLLDGMNHVLWASIGLLIVAFGLAFLLPRRARPEPAAEPEPTDATQPEPAAATR